MSYQGFTKAWRRAVEYLRAALRKATSEVARTVTPQPSALGYARIPRK
jgi:hypothetical protein